VLEIVGYIASVLVAVSLTMSSLLRLRVVNLVGSSVFAIYGYLIGATPVFLVNAFIACVNVWYLLRFFNTKEFLRLLEVKWDSEYVRHFIAMNLEDIRRYAPEFKGAAHEGDVVFLVLRDVAPAGLFIGRIHPAGCLAIELDYVLPQYRDFKVGRFLFHEQAKYFRARGIHRMEATAAVPKHAGYLRRMGFMRDAAREYVYVREIG